MISGRLTSDLESMIDLQLLDFLGRIHIEAVMLDTGFTGELTLSPQLISTLGLPWRTKRVAKLADGSLKSFDIFEATVLWNGLSKNTLVQAIDNIPLLGMAFLLNHRIQVDVVRGGQIIIDAIP